jgi:hypothetical protein
MGMQHQSHRYHVRYIVGSRMPDDHDWIYLPGERPTLLLRVGADERQVFDEVAEMLGAGSAAWPRQVA